MHTISVRDVKKHAAQILAKNNMRKPEIHANGHSNGNFCSKGRLGGLPSGLPKSTEHPGVEFLLELLETQLLW